MINKEIIFMAYANSKLDPLPSLIEEYQQVYGTLINKSLAGHYLIHPELYATTENVNKYLNLFKDKLVIFSYSGHAGKSSLLLDDKDANAAGIAMQLSESALAGVLKLVVLNGCSTAGQVKKLLECGVPAVVATHASVDDLSAKEFAVRFFQNMSEKHSTISQAFMNALGPAQLASKNQNLSDRAVRNIGFAQSLPDDKPLWELFSKYPESVEINPLPIKSYGTVEKYVPNEKLFVSIYDSLDKHGSENIKYWKNEEESGKPVSYDVKMTAILGNFPFPVSTHLQKLFAPIDDEDKGFDKANLLRLKQIGQIFHSTVEFMGVIMIAQLWELKLRNEDLEIPSSINKLMSDYFYMKAADRDLFNYMVLLRSIREYFETLPEVQYFIRELADLIELAKREEPFEKACRYLYQLRTQTLLGQILNEDIISMCIESENMLCTFFDGLGFMHRYSLTSIQDINTLKLRHELSPHYKHRIFDLMRGNRTKEVLYYLLSNYLDSMGIILRKQEVKLTRVKQGKPVFSAKTMDYLNLSPFLIDRAAFEEGNISNLMFFNQYWPSSDIYEFKNVSVPDSNSDFLRVGNEESYEPIRLQFDAFRNMILNEVPD